MDASQAGGATHVLCAPLVTNDFVVEADLFKEPQDALRAGIVEMMDLDQRHEFPAPLSQRRTGHSTRAGPLRAILSPRAARITQPKVTVRPMTSGRCRTPSQYPSPPIAAATQMMIPTSGTARGSRGRGP